ncbi:hypothetical protein L917_07479, partial [Phytophthora nicotianae]
MTRESKLLDHLRNYQEVFEARFLYRAANYVQDFILSCYKGNAVSFAERAFNRGEH